MKNKTNKQKNNNQILVTKPQSVNIKSRLYLKLQTSVFVLWTENVRG